MPVHRIALLSIDTLRRDAVSFYRVSDFYDRHRVPPPDTPVLDAFFEKALVFVNAFSTASYTSTAHASMLTGLYPPSHGLRSFVGERLSSNVKSVVKFLREKGYRIIFGVDFLTMFQAWGLLDDADLVFDITSLDARDSLFNHINHERNVPVFLFLHFSDVHSPYCLRRDYGDDQSFFKTQILSTAEKLGQKKRVEALVSAGRFKEAYEFIFKEQRVKRLLEMVGLRTEGLISQAVHLYARGVEFFDRGRFKEYMDFLESAGFMDAHGAVIVTADHGEDVQSGMLGHINLLTDGVLRVPLAIGGAGLSPGMKEEISSITDVGPTIAQLAGFLDEWKKEHAHVARGRSLLDDERKNSYVYAEFWSHNLTSDELLKSFAQKKKYSIINKLTQVCVRTPTEKLWINGLLENSFFSSQDKERGKHFYVSAFVEEMFKEPYVPTRLKHRIIAKIGVFLYYISQLPLLGRLAEKIGLFVVTHIPGIRETAHRYVYFQVKPDGEEVSRKFMSRVSSQVIPLKNMADEILKKAVPSQWWSEDALQSVEERLRDLGYID